MKDRTGCSGTRQHGSDIFLIDRIVSAAMIDVPQIAITVPGGITCSPPAVMIDYAGGGKSCA
jgi:hypothetical protein